MAKVPILFLFGLLSLVSCRGEEPKPVEEPEPVASVPLDTPVPVDAPVPLDPLVPVDTTEPIEAPEPEKPVRSILFEQEQLACEKQGGRFGKGGDQGLNYCFRTPKDAGKACSGSADCEGICLAKSRTCAPVVPLLGCNEELVARGRVATTCRG
ncbi:MAG: hypothetical protein AAFV38_05755 [Pseudomonadota bacterium]